MKLIKFLWDTSPSRTLTIIALTILNGVSGGLLLILIPDAASKIFWTDQYFFYAVSLPLTTALFVITRHLSRKKTVFFAEQSLENMVLRVSNTVRLAELSDLEQTDMSNIFMTLSDSQIISSGANEQLEALQANISLFIGWLYIFFCLSQMTGLIILISRLFMLLVTEMFGKIFRNFAHEELKENKKMFGALRNLLYGFNELKFNKKKADDIFENYFLQHIENNKITRIRARRYFTEFNIIIILNSILLTVLVVMFLAAAPQDVMNIIIILIFSAQNDMLINSSIQNVALASAVLERIKRLFPESDLRKADENVSLISKSNKELPFTLLSLENITFHYLDVKEKGFSVHIDRLNIRAGEILFIVGGNGSGKSTLLKLLTGMYPPDIGTIRMDGRTVSMAEYRHIFSGVFSDFHLFDQLYGIEDVDEERLKELLELTELSKKTDYDPQTGFTTLNLSTGQRKRLALIVAMMEDNPVFIFDEWAADQDPHFRYYFYETILPSLKKQGKTIIAITHDDRYFHIADTVIRMEYGKIEEQWCPEKETAAQPLFRAKSLGATLGNLDKRLENNKISINSKKRHYQKNIDSKKNLKISKEEKNAVKNIFFHLILFCFSMVGVTISVVHLPMQKTIEPAWYISFILLLVLMVFSFRRANGFFFQAVENRIAAMRINVMNQVRRTDLLTFKQVGREKIYSTLTSDIRAIANISNILLISTQGAVRISMIYIYIAYLSLPIFLIMLFLTGVGVTLYMSNHIKMVALLEMAEEQKNKVIDAFTHLLEGFKELKLNNTKSNDFYSRCVRYRISALKELNVKASRYYVMNSSISYGFWKGMLLVMILILPFTGLSIDILPVAVVLVLTMPIRQIIDRYSQFHMAYMSLQRLFHFENKMKNLAEEETEGNNLECFEKIEYKNIFFIYDTKDNSPFSIGPMSITVKAGEVIFITGGNGSGKSTLLNTITGLYPLVSGQIAVNEEETDIQSQRELFSPIFTDFHLFDRLYGMKNVDEEKLANLLKLFKLEKKVEWIDEKFSTLDLSTGQKKRLAMLVTMMEDKPVYIFDEWAADQDPHFREYFYTTLLPTFKKQGKTVIAVTHDDRYFETADRVLHLEYGQLTEG